MDDPPIERTTQQARAGSTPHIVRWVLGISLTLTIVAMAVILLFSFEPDESPNPSNDPPQDVSTAN